MIQAMTYKVAFAAAGDCGNRAMRAGGRKVWSVGDYRKACEEFERLWPAKTNPQTEPEVSK
jgi:hypothetical protein